MLLSLSHHTVSQYAYICKRQVQVRYFFNAILMQYFTKHLSLQQIYLFHLHKFIFLELHFHGPKQNTNHCIELRNRPTVLTNSSKLSLTRHSVLSPFRGLPEISTAFMQYTLTLFSEKRFSSFFIHKSIILLRVAICVPMYLTLPVVT